MSLLGKSSPTAVLCHLQEAPGAACSEDSGLQAHGSSSMKSSVGTPEEWSLTCAASPSSRSGAHLGIMQSRAASAYALGESALIRLSSDCRGSVDTSTAASHGKQAHPSAA